MLRAGAGLAATCLFAPGGFASQGPLIAVAASLRMVAEQIAADLELKTGSKVRHAFGATGILVRQIESGAPFEALMAADMTGPERLVRAGLATEEGARIFARGRLVLIVRKGAGLDAADGLDGLKAAAAAGRIGRLAIANPELAPYGLAAREALQAAGIWSGVASRLVLSENVAQVVQFVAAGGADAGLTASSLMRPEVPAGVAAGQEVPEGLHAPINHGLVILKTASATAREYARFVTGEAGRRRLTDAGFATPG